MRIKQAAVRHSAVALLGMAALAVAGPRVQAQLAQHPQRIAPTERTTVAPAEEFNWPEQNLSPSTSLFNKTQQPHWRYNMSPAEYAALKQAAAAQRQGTKNGNSIKADGITPFTTFKHIYEGLNEFSVNDGFWIPPDVNAAASKANVVETVNSAVAVFSKTGTLQKATALSTFMLQSVSQTDPNVLFDPVWQRFVVTDINHDNASDGTHTLNIAISKTSNPSGAWWVYHVVVAGSNNFWDYPHSGQTQDAILITGNFFFAAGGAEGRALAIAKAKLYNGLGFSVPVFTGLPFDFIPPNVMDQSDEAWCAHPDLNDNSSNQIWLYDFGDAANAFEAYMSGPFKVSTSITQNSPPSATQPGTSSKIDTLDGRFQYRGQQNGNRLLLTNCLNLAGFPATALYDINTSSLTASSSHFYFASATSDDWNPHVALLNSGNVGVEWNSDDTSVNPGIRIAGGAASSIGSGVQIFTSSSNYLDGRWGDYSSLQVDPSAATTLWGANEYAIDQHTWGTKFFSFTIP